MRSGNGISATQCCSFTANPYTTWETAPFSWMSITQKQEILFLSTSSFIGFLPAHALVTSQSKICICRLPRIWSCSSLDIWQCDHLRSWLSPSPEGLCLALAATGLAGNLAAFTRHFQNTQRTAMSQPAWGAALQGTAHPGLLPGEAFEGRGCAEQCS